MAKGINFNGPLRANIKELPGIIDKRLNAVMHYQAQRSKTYMKRNAPWTDRTANARQGLDTKVIRIPNVSYAIVLFHQVPYGIWLEVRFNGKYAAISPAIQAAIPELKGLLNGLLGRT